MELSIVINNYKTKGLLKQCLKGILMYPPSVDFEVVVVDNNSKDGSVELAKEWFPEVHPVKSAAGGSEKPAFNGVKVNAADENLGHHKGNNLGIKNSTGKYVLLLNTDIALLDDSIDKMYQFMEENSDAAIVGAKLKNPDGSIQMSCMRFPNKMVPIYRRTFLGKFKSAKREIDHYQMNDFDHQKTRAVDWVLGSCTMVRRDAILLVGLMDEELFMYFGDVAWCRQFWQAGYKVYYFVDTDIVHYHRRESADSIFSRIFWIHIIDWFRYLRKYSKK